MKIEYEEDKCIGCGACVAVCPNNWEMKNTKAHPKSLDSDVECNKDAANTCPVQCIHIKE